MSNKFLNLILLLSITGSAFCGKGSSIQGSNNQGSSRLGSGLGATADTDLSRSVVTVLATIDDASQQHRDTSEIALAQIASNSRPLKPIDVINPEDLSQYMPQNEHPGYWLGRDLCALAGIQNSTAVRDLVNAYQKEGLRTEKDLRARFKNLDNNILDALKLCKSHENKDDIREYAQHAMVILKIAQECNVQCDTIKTVSSWVDKVLNEKSDEHKVSSLKLIAELTTFLNLAHYTAGQRALTATLASRQGCPNYEAFSRAKESMDSISQLLAAVNALRQNDFLKVEQQETEENNSESVPSSPRLTSAQQAGPSQQQQGSTSNVPSLVLPPSGAVAVVDPSMSGVS